MMNVINKFRRPFIYMPDNINKNLLLMLIFWFCYKTYFTIIAFHVIFSVRKEMEEQNMCKCEMA
jgi:hypothetical protein